MAASPVVKPRKRAPRSRKHQSDGALYNHAIMLGRLLPSHVDYRQCMKRGQWLIEAGSMNWLSAYYWRLIVPLFIAADADEDLVDEHGNKIAIPEKHGTPILHTRPKSNKQRLSQVRPR